MSAATAKKISAQSPMEIASEVTRITGVQFSEKHRLMIETRIQRRMQEVGIKNILEYMEYYTKNYKIEIGALISLLTTHHTYFFREYPQFETLEKRLPELIKQARQRPSKTIQIWSAACSQGHEVYSISMFLKSQLSTMAPDVGFQILGTDIDPQCISIAENGVYTRKEINEIPLVYLGTNWARGTGEILDYVKVKPSIKDHCQFGVANILELPAFISQQKFDIIFCRNIFIYFDMVSVAVATANILKCLAPQGIFVVGLTESLEGLALGLKSIGPSIYTAKDNDIFENKPKESIKVVSEQASTQVNMKPLPQNKEPIRVLCVDDSDAILLLLSKALTKEEGFEIVATAKSGIEAAKKLKEVSADIVTLDIHMPEQDGIEYLRKNYGPNHPPVVMVTAVARDDSDLAIKSIQLGASDYVEKPVLSNFNERAEEIRIKIRAAHHMRSHKNQLSIELDRSFLRPQLISNPNQKLRIIVACLSNREGIKHVLKSLNGPQPPTYILVEGSESVLPAFAKQLHLEINLKIEHINIPSGNENINSIWLCDLKAGLNSLKNITSKKRTSILVFGDVSNHAAKQVLELSNAQLLLEDLNSSVGNTKLTEVATDIVPFTSFAYLSSEFLSGDKK